MTYNVPQVTLDTAIETSVAYVESGIIPVLICAPGVGKTTSAQVIAAELGAELRCIRLNNILPEEVTGLQYVDGERKRSVHLPPKWLPNPDGSDGRVLVLIDEITQAPDENRKAIMSALLEGYLGDTAVASNCSFIAAGNSAEDGTNVYEFDRATADRFGVIRIKPDVVSWCNDYAPKHDIDLSITAFLRVCPYAFEMSEEAAKGDNVVAPSPRTWVAVDRFIKTAKKRGVSEDALAAGIMGKVGIEIGTAFAAVRRQAEDLKSVRELLDMPKSRRAEYTPRTLEALWTYCQGLIWHATSVDNMVEAFELLDSFHEVDEVPFHETRFTVAETMLTRAINVHRLEGIFNDARLQDHMRRWRREIQEIAASPPEAERNQVEEIRYAA